MKRFLLGAAALLTAAVMLAGCGKESVPESAGSSSPSAVETAAPAAEPDEPASAEQEITSPPEDESEPETEPESVPETEPETAAPTVTELGNIDDTDDSYVDYYFRSEKLLNQHFAKHGGEFGEEFGYETAEDYELGASDVINDPDALFKLEAEDGDGVYYIEDTNEFVILSEDGYIRTYFRPSAGKAYFDRQ